MSLRHTRRLRLRRWKLTKAELAFLIDAIYGQAHVRMTPVFIKLRRKVQ